MKIQDEIFMIAIRKNELLKIIEPNNPKHEKMLELIVNRLEIQLAAPENEIVRQGSEENDSMYFVQKGECSVQVQDKIGLDAGIKRVRTLYAGDHFGVRSLYHILNLCIIGS
jgi:signal-transduction protein with cAMP-binding, CBS, and nucleotidyltransferase domain